MDETIIAPSGGERAKFVPPARQHWNGERIRLLRQAHDLSQSALAHRVGVSQTTVSAWERGGRLKSGVMQRLLDYVAAGQAGGPPVRGASAHRALSTEGAAA